MYTSPGWPGRDVVSLVVEHVHLGTRPGQADRTGPGQPLRPGDDGPAALAGGVVLGDHRAPPVQHLPLDVGRAGRGAVDRGAHRGHVVAAPGLLRQGEEPAELRGHHVRVGHPVPLHQREQFLGVEAVHQHDRVAELERDRREVQHRRVVERRAAQVHVPVAGREREYAEEPGRRHRRLVRVLAGQRAANALGPAGRARGVDHGRARRTRVGAPFAAGAERGQRREAGHRAHREAGPGIDARPRGRLGRDLAEPLVGDERPGAAVGQDVGHLGRGQVPVDRHHVQPGLDGREEQREGLGAVRQHPGDAVARAQAERLQAARVPVGQGGQPGVADGRATGVDDRRPFGITGGDGPQADVGHGA